MDDQAPVTRKELAEAIVLVRKTALLSLLSFAKGFSSTGDSESKFDQFIESDRELQRMIERLAPGMPVE